MDTVFKHFCVRHPLFPPNSARQKRVYLPHPYPAAQPEHPVCVCRADGGCPREAVQVTERQAGERREGKAVVRPPSISQAHSFSKPTEFWLN